jgi:tol-pal system protein YbgF
VSLPRRRPLPPLSSAPFLAALATVLFVTAGCSGSGLLGSRTAASPPPADVQEMQRRLVELQRKAAVTEVELERLRERVAELEGRAGIRPSTRPATEPRTRPAPSPSRLDDSRELERSSGRTGSTVEIEDIEVQEVPRSGPPSTPPRAVEEPDPVSPSAPMPSPGSPSGSAGEVTEAAQALYDRGYTQYHQGRFVDAESSFQRFIQSYPATELTDNAQYWIGESRLARGDGRGALSAFRETVERYPRGNKVPDALLKVGETMASLGDAEGAREAYGEVVRRFAGTTAARVAEDRLAALP